MQKDVKFGAEIMWGEFRSVKIRREILNKMSSLLCHLLGSTAHISPKVEVKLFSCVHFFATPWTVAYQASPSVGFSRQGYRSGVPFPSPGDLPNPGIEPGLLLCRQMVYPLSTSIFSCFFFFFSLEAITEEILKFQHICWPEWEWNAGLVLGRERHRSS